MHAWCRAVEDEIVTITNKTSSGGPSLLNGSSMYRVGGGGGGAEVRTGLSLLGRCRDEARALRRWW